MARPAWFTFVAFAACFAMTACTSSRDAAKSTPAVTADDGATLAQCPTRSRLNVVACPSRSPTDSQYGTNHLEGAVTTVDSLWSCNLDVVSPYPGTEDRAWTFGVSDGARYATVSVALPWSVPLVAVGDAVSLDYESQSFELGGGTVNVVIRRGTGELLLWAAQEIHADNLTPPPELQVADGAAICEREDCGTLEWRSVTYAVNDETTEVSPGGVGEVGGLTVLNGFNEQQVVGGQCSDYSGGLINVAAIGMDVATLDALERGPCASSMCADGEYCAIPDGAACDATSAQAVCEPMPSTCPDTCPGACGCDGKYYCNDCEAHRLGDEIATGNTTCMDVGCDSGATAADGPDGCTVIWGCYGRHYEVHCTVTGDTMTCECVMDGMTTGSFDTSTPPLCSAPAIPAGCHYPSWQ